MSQPANAVDMKKPDAEADSTANASSIQRDNEHIESGGPTNNHDAASAADDPNGNQDGVKPHETVTKVTEPENNDDGHAATSAAVADAGSAPPESGNDSIANLDGEKQQRKGSEETNGHAQKDKVGDTLLTNTERVDLDDGVAKEQASREEAQPSMKQTVPSNAGSGFEMKQGSACDSNNDGQRSKEGLTVADGPHAGENTDTGGANTGIQGADGGMRANSNINEQNLPPPQNKVAPTIAEVVMVEPQEKKTATVVMEEVEVIEPVRKSQRARKPSVKLSAPSETNKPTLPSKPPAPTTQSAPKTPQELYDQIKKSRDKLFFIAYSHNKDPLVTDKSKKKGSNKNKKMEYQWYLVRVDLSTCQQLEDTENCHETGKYYVELYTKASYDQGVLLPGNPLENGIPASKMKAKPDSDSRYWLEWHEYYFDKNGDMVVGKAKEFLPNSKKAINRRLMDLAQRKRAGPSSPGSSNSEEGEERLMSEYHPNFDKYTTWADVLDLMDTKTRLVGPFDFDDIKPPPLQEKDLAFFNEEMAKLLTTNHANLYVKDRVHLSRWEELLVAIKGRDIEPPKVVVGKRQKEKRVSGSKRRASEESRGQGAQLVDEKRLREMPMGQASQLSGDKRGREEPKGAVCQQCGKSASELNPLLLFPATSSQSSLCVHESCGRKSRHQTIVSKDKMKKQILSAVEAAFTQTRQAISGDGQAYCVMGEVKDALTQALGKCMRAKDVHAGVNVTLVAAKSSEPLEGLPEANFTEEEIGLFPVAFAYHNNDQDGISEENAKIATLDYEVEQRRLGRTGQSKTSKDKIKTKKSTPQKNHPSVGEKDGHIAPEPAEGFPDGWLARKIPRANKMGSVKADTFYYSPKLQFKFRSKPEVRRFLEVMKSTGGDESLAIEKFNG